MKYRIVGFDVPPGSEVVIPDGVTPLNTLYHPITGLLTLACIQPIVEEKKTPPAKEEEAQPEEVEPVAG